VRNFEKNHFMRMNNAHDDMRPSARAEEPVRHAFKHLDAYTDGDPDFKQVLIPLIIENLLELQQALHWANERCDLSFFHKACHKASTTLDMLECKEFMDIVEELKANIGKSDSVTLFDKYVKGFIQSLGDEKL
jgi:hypothetical protein